MFVKCCVCEVFGSNVFALCVLRVVYCACVVLVCLGLIVLCVV